MKKPAKYSIFRPDRHFKRAPPKIPVTEDNFDELSGKGVMKLTGMEHRIRDAVEKERAERKISGTRMRYDKVLKLFNKREEGLWKHASSA